jgi:hypothetical protein
MAGGEVPFPIVAVHVTVNCQEWIVPSFFSEYGELCTLAALSHCICTHYFLYGREKWNSSLLEKTRSCCSTTQWYNLSYSESNRPVLWYGMVVVWYVWYHTIPYGTC